MPIPDLLHLSGLMANSVTPPALPPAPQPLAPPPAPPTMPDPLNPAVTPPERTAVTDLYSQAISPVESQGSSPMGMLGLIAQMKMLQGVGGGGGAAGGGGGGLPVSGSASDQQFLNILHNQLGSPYVFGAEGQMQGGHRTFDCSGLVDWALNQAGVNVPRMSAAGYQKMFGSNVGPHNLRPGDAVFFYYPNDRGIPQGEASHIGIYWGNGQFIEAPHTGDVVKIAPMDWSAFIGGARIPGLWG